MNDLPEFPPAVSAVAQPLTAELAQLVLHAFFYGVLCTCVVAATIWFLLSISEIIRNGSRVRTIRKDPDFIRHVDILEIDGDLPRSEAEAVALASYPKFLNVFQPKGSRDASLVGVEGAKPLASS